MSRFGLMKSSETESSSISTPTLAEYSPEEFLPPQQPVPADSNNPSYDPYGVHPQSSQASRSVLPGPAAQTVSTTANMDAAAMQAPITLAWEPPAETRQDIPSNEVEGNLEPPLGQPPSYDVARIPQHPVTYTFSRLATTSSGLLLPPADSPDTRPLYHISVCNDFMMPHCLITSLYKGSSTEGKYIGGFTTIINAHSDGTLGLSKHQTVTIKNKEVPTQQLFDKSSNHPGHSFKWRINEQRKALLWTSSGWPKPNGGIIECFPYQFPYITPKPPRLATYRPNKRLRASLDAPPEPLLTITPAGHKHLDDIVLSLLLLERERLSLH